MVTPGSSPGLRFCVLGSGSKGNCTYVESAGRALLIDCGFSGVEVERRLSQAGLDPARIELILVTHEHRDHVSGVGVLSRKYRLPVHANQATRLAAGSLLDGLHRFVAFRTGETFTVPPFVIHPFAVCHDTAEPVGFTISAGGRSLGYCTDTGRLSRLICHHLGACQGLVLEANHDLEMLRQGPYPPALQQRIRSKNGHLANPEAMAFLQAIAHPGLRHVVLAHISEANNCHQLVRSEAEQGLPGTVCFSLACQDAPGQVVRLD